MKTTNKVLLMTLLAGFIITIIASLVKMNDDFYTNYAVWIGLFVSLAAIVGLLIHNFSKIRLRISGNKEK
ncbi:MAG: hypothetical protein Q4F57_02145 [Weeksellaceae bacterium]|nr:hypothetical protein [Weeksellaceae bacterium]